MQRLVAFIMALLSIFLLSTNCDNSWIPLIRDNDLTGWTILNGKADFTIEDGVITGTSRMNTPNTFLATEKEYSDFILEYEVKLDDGQNSGVQIRSHSTSDYMDGRVHGYQVELDASPRSWSGGIYDEARRGWLYNLECNPKAKAAYKNGEWNAFRVVAIGNHIRVWLNGVQTADVVDDMDASGFIALQVHNIGTDTEKEGKIVRFRNMRIKTEGLDREKSPITKAIPQISYLNNVLTEREMEEGWTLLWDGQSTEGWRGAKTEHFPAQGWEMDDGVLTVLKSDGGESTFGGDIVTIEKYSNFELEVDFKYTEAANSGIKYFVDTELNKGEGSAIGCEYQIVDDLYHPDATMGSAGNRSLASLYDLIPANAKYYAPNENVEKRVNKYNWNRAKIVVNGNHIEHYLNGIKVVQYERRTQMWRALVARSKYVVWPNFGEADEGHILLQDHGDEVSYRNIKLKTLK